MKFCARIFKIVSQNEVIFSLFVLEEGWGGGKAKERRGEVN